MHASASDTSRRHITITKKTGISIAVLATILPLVGSFAKDRLTQESRDSAMAERVRSLTESQHDAVQRAEFERAMKAIDQRFDQVREDLRDIKRATSK